MPESSPKFCSECGAPLQPGVRFCPTCGRAVLSYADPAAPQPAPTVPPAPTTWTQPASSLLGAEVLEGAPERPRRAPRLRQVPTRVLVAAGVATLVLGGGAITAGVLLGGGDDRPDSIEAVTSEPSLEWTYDAGSGVRAVRDAGDDQLVVLNEDGDLVSLDGDGEEQWSTPVDGLGEVSYIYTEPGFDMTVAIGWDDDEQRLAGYSRDGEEEWTVDGNAIWIAEDHLLVTDGSTLRRIDARTGEEEWSVAAGGAATARPDVVVLVRDGEVRRLDPGSGEERWSTDIAGSDDPGDGSSVTVTESMAVVSTGTNVEAFALATGASLWSAELDLENPYVGDAGGGRAFVVQTDYVLDESEEGLTVRIYDEDGEVDSFESEDWFFVGPFTAGGTTYLVSSEGRAYDEDFEQVGTEHDGIVAIVDRGVYELHGGTVEFFEFDDTEPVWTLDGDFGDEEDGSTQLHATDGRVLVVHDGTLTSYS